MEVIKFKSYKDINLNIDNLSIILGCFDGIHVGHRNLIEFAKFDKNDNPLAIVTFSESLSCDKKCLTSVEQRINLLSFLDVDYLFIVECDEDFFKLSYIDYINKFLKRINPSTIYLGKNFRFGLNDQGDIYDLKLNFKNVKALDYVKDNCNNIISNSIIKEKILIGEVEEANLLLGRKFSIEGEVIKGLGNGSKIGFKTANLFLNLPYVIPKNGVYITKVEIDGIFYNSITNIGFHPSIDKLDKISIETHILNFDKDLYNKTINLYFYKYLRDEKQFLNLNELIKQIELDIKEADNYFKYKNK